MARTKAEIISEMVDAGMTDDEIRSAFKQSPSAPAPSESTIPSMAKSASSSIMDTLKRFGTPKGVFESATDPLSTPLKTGGRIVRDNPEGAIEAIPAAAVGIASLPLMATGVGILPAAAALGSVGAGGAYARQGMRTARGLPATVPGRHPIIESLLGGESVMSRLPDRARDIVTEGAASALPEFLGPIAMKGASKAMGAGTVLKDLGIGMAKRSQGIAKSQLYASKSWSETMRKIAQTDRAAEEALLRHDLPYLGGAEEMAKRATNLLKEGSDKVGSSISAASKSGIQIGAPDFAEDVIKKLNPRLPAEKAVAKKIIDDLESLSSPYGLISPEDLNRLRQYWGKLGWRDKTVSSVDADVYREAWKQASDSFHEVLDTVSHDTAAIYKEGMRQEEMANVALGGITNRMAAEEGNAFISTPGFGTKIQKRIFAPLARATYAGGRMVNAGANAVKSASRYLPFVGRSLFAERKKE